MANFDQDQLKQLAKGSSKAFQLIFDRYYSELIHIAEYYMKDAKQVEDVIQDVFLQLWEKRSKLKIHTTLRAYLVRSVQNKCIDKLRRNTLSDKYQDDQKFKLREAILMQSYADNSLGVLYEKELKEKLVDALEKLPEKCLMTFQLSRDEGMKNADIAKEMGISEKAVERNMTRSLKILRRELSEYLSSIVL
ncbi:RNA polymerase sigma-70 factor [Marinifilum sp.]|uniref:RNA polymerase sigma-70 factor n=1 Tax=Marinifilum sp. TaxID=2033137 RepID=UPI003BADBAD8